MASAICFTLWPLLQKVSEYTGWLVVYVWPRVTVATGTILLDNPLVPAASLVVIALLLSLAVVPLVLAGALRRGHFRTFFLYPPVWFAALLPVAMFLFVYPPKGMDMIVILEGIALILTSSLLTLLIMRSFDGGGKKAPREVDVTPLPTAAETLKKFAENPLAELIPWLESDAPVEDPSNDLFEFHVFAERIAKLVTQPQLKRVGLIGPYGSGKSTVLNLVDHILRPPRILTCRVRAWGFAKEAAAAVVLREAVAELSKHMDCLSVQGLPEKYMAAMKSTTPGWVHAPLAASVADNPLQQLKRLDPLLEAINARLIIFIEDLDRNMEMPDVPTGSNGRVFLEVESLMDRMREVDRVSFVLAISRGCVNSLDLKRLLDHEVELFGLDLGDVWPVIQAFVRYCDEYADNEGDLQIASEEELKVFRESGPHTIYSARMSPDKSILVPLTQILRTPRFLKHALRGTWLAWKTLHGEVNLCDLLVYNAICTDSSQATAFIREHQIALSSSPDLEDADKNEIVGFWNAQMKGISDKERAWLWQLIEHLFPVLVGGTHRTRVQGISKDRCWQRIANGRIVRDDLQDQVVIKDFAKWKESGNASPFLEKLMSDLKYTNRFVDLFYDDRPAQVGLNGEEFLCLVSQLFQKMRENRPDVQADNNICSVLSYLLGQRQFDDYGGWLWSELEKTMPVSLLLRNEIELNWGRLGSFTLSKDAKDTIESRTCAFAREILVPKKLCRLLSGVPDFTLLHLVRGPRRRPTPELKWDSWLWLGPVLLDSLHNCGNVMIPQAIGLFFSQWKVNKRNKNLDSELSGGRTEHVYKLRIERLQKIFPNPKDLEHFVELIMQSSTGEDAWPDDTKLMVSQARAELAVWPKEGLT